MKILKYLLGIVVLLGIIFLALGFISPTVTYGTEVEVNKPLKESWAVYNDATKMGDWLEGFKSIELISGNHNEVGSKYKVAIEQDGEAFDITETITSKEEFDHMNFEFDNHFMTSHVNVNFAEKGGKTHMKSDAVAEGKGMLAKSLMVLFKGSMSEQDRKNMTALKSVIEANTTDYYPEPAIIPEDESAEASNTSVAE